VVTSRIKRLEDGAGFMRPTSFTVLEETAHGSGTNAHNQVEGSEVLVWVGDMCEVVI
jgi:hypothetical protein